MPLASSTNRSHGAAIQVSVVACPKKRTINATFVAVSVSGASKISLEQGENLTELPGIGEDLAAKIQDIVETGTTLLFGKLRKKIPPALTELLHLPGLGPKRVKTLYHELDIHALEQLHRAALYFTRGQAALLHAGMKCPRYKTTPDESG